jgi:hypothetical protein
VNVASCAKALPQNADAASMKTQNRRRATRSSREVFRK